MYFKRIEMHGFKSFAEPVVIEFHEGVTCIVGPNGSGKSNISDAIRWVLGEQSPKMLRGGKMEEVIFAGTANRKSRGMAEVTLVIDNSANILPIDYNEVAITRRMYRSGESEYMINNNQCRLRDIRELIMDTGIGVDGYSIIGQGKIADIVSNKPESRREIFEEAAGVVMYKSKKAEAERKLSATKSNLDRINDIVGEIEGRIDGLREDSIKAKEYLELRDRYKDLEINITLKNIEKLDNATADIRQDVKNLEKMIADTSSYKNNLDEDILSNRKKNDNLEQLSNDARDSLLKKVEEINAINNLSQLNNERLGTIDRDFERISSEVNSLQDKQSVESVNADDLNQKKSQITEELKLQDALLQSEIQKYNEITSRSLTVSEQLENDRNEMFLLHSGVSAKRSEAKSMESYIETLDKRKAELIEGGRQIEESRIACRRALEDALKEKKSGEESLKSIKDNHDTNRIKLQELSKNIDELNLKCDELRIKSSQLISRKKTIEEMENNYEGYNGAVRFIMKSGISGIEGTAGDLISVPEGFETAIETAMGGALQNIVCKTDSSAKECVNSLKINKAGRCTFLPIESVKGSEASINEKISRSSGFKGLACNLISYDKKYDGIFKYLLGRVVVVDNMDNAVCLSKISNAGVRFVTVDGEIINASGAITGGKYKNKTANLLARKSEIGKLSQEIETINGYQNQLLNELEEYKEQSSALSKECEALEETERKNEISLLNTVNRIKSLEENASAIEERKQKRDREFSNIEKDFAGMEESAAKALKEADDAEIQIQALDEKISAAMERLQTIKEEAENTNEAITAVRIKKTAQENKLESIINLMSRSEESLNELKKQIQLKKLELENLGREKNQILFGRDESKEKFHNLSHEKQELEEYINRITHERTTLSEQLSSQTSEQVSVGNKLNSFQDQKYQQEIRLAKNETQLDTLKEKLWNEFEIPYIKALELKKEDFAITSAMKESREIKNRMKDLGDVHIGAIKEYDQVSQRYSFLTEQRSDILSAMEELQNIITDMDRTIKSKFKENFDQVVVNFEEIFKELFGGGHAELSLDDENNPLEAGIEIVAQPPGKKLQNINLMSGGEKTMTAISLMFAVLKTKPTPFCILDEVEAALDDSNIDRFAKYLRKFNDIQFAIVTHQKATMEHADVLYGVTMPEQGISKVLSLRLGDNFEI